MRPTVRQPDADRSERTGRRISGARLKALLGVLLALWASSQGGAQAPADPESSGGSDVAVRASMIATGFDGDKYSAMIQVAVDGSPLPGATWDLEASLVSAGRAHKKLSGRVNAKEPGTPVVLEFQVEVRPGSYELTVTAHETTAGQSGTRAFKGHWPDPNEDPISISPIVLLQPSRGTFVRGESARGQGALARGPRDRIEAELPIALVSVVCRRADQKQALRIERTLEGVKQVEFEPIRLEPGGDRCAQVRDLIEPGKLLEGYFKYEVKLRVKSGAETSRVREFDTVAGTQGKDGRSASKGGRPAF